MPIRRRWKLAKSSLVLQTETAVELPDTPSAKGVLSKGQPVLHADRGKGKVTAIDWHDDSTEEKPRKADIAYIYTVTYASGEVQQYDAKSAASKLRVLGPTISTLPRFYRLHAPHCDHMLPHLSTVKLEVLADRAHCRGT